ncbi:MAG: pilus assembly protein [Alicyclobacillus sp.]|nr:pilus assembly protein [Alicyclobacillus sp.]
MRTDMASEDGQSLLEFALVLPVLALLLLGMVDFGRILAAYLMVSEASRDAVRSASVGDSDSQIGQVVVRDAGWLGGSLRWQVDPPGSRQSGDPVTVTVSADVPVFDPLLGALLGSDYPVQAALTMRTE